MNADSGLTPNCSRARAELVAHLYGELEAGASRELERHIAGCPRCAARRRDLQQTHAALDEWPLPLALSSQDERPMRRRRFAPLLTGVAAALIAFFALAALQTEVRAEKGTLTLSLAWPGTHPEADVPPAYARAVDLDLLGFALEERQRAMAQAIESTLARDRALLARAFEHLTQDAALEDQRTREALFELASHVVAAR